MAHKNSDDSEELHHLYEIVDKVDYDTFKYGISCGPISNKDGMSKRMRVQLRFANLIDNWARFSRGFLYMIFQEEERRNESSGSISKHTKIRMAEGQEEI